METAIMHRLQNSILQQSSLLIDVVQCAAQLDWLDHPHTLHLSIICQSLVNRSSIIIIYMHRLQNSISQQSSLLIDVVQCADQLDWLDHPHTLHLSITCQSSVCGIELLLFVEVDFCK